MAQKDKVKELVGRGLDSYHTKALQQIDRIEKKNKEQNHKISILTNELDNDYLTKTEEGSVISLEHSKEGMVYLDELQGNTLVNYCSDGSKELTLNGDIDVEGTNVTITDTADNGLVDVMCEGNTLVNLFDFYELGQWRVNTILAGAIYTCTAAESQGSGVMLKFSEHTKRMIIGKRVRIYIHDLKTDLSDSSFAIYNRTTGDMPYAILYKNYKGYIDVTIPSNWLITDDIEILFYIDGLGSTVSFNRNVVILESTQYEDIEYFEGMKSVGECEDNKIEILSQNYQELNTDTNGLVCHLKAGTSAITNNIMSDLSGNGNNATLYGTSINGNYLNFNGESDYATINRCVSDDFTISLKAEVISAKGGSLGDDSHWYEYAGLVDGEYPDIANDFGLTITNEGYPCLGIGKPDTTVRHKETCFNKLTTFTYTRNKTTGEMKLYIDGKHSATISSTNKDSLNDNPLLTIGRSPTKTAAYAKIKFYELKIYNKVLNEGEIFKFNKKEILLNEPLRSLPDGTKDKIVKINSKWFIERNTIYCDSTVDNFNIVSETQSVWGGETTTAFRFDGYNFKSKGDNSLISVVSDSMICVSANDGQSFSKTENEYLCLHSNGFIIGAIKKSKITSTLTNYFRENSIKFITKRNTPIYEPLEIEPTLNTYNDVTHISNNSIIPCNMKVKNTGYNTIIKPSTLYTVALDTNKSGTVGINLGGAKVTTTNNVATITTPATLSDDSLRLYGKGIKSSKVRLLEGDKTNWIPSHFEGMKSSFEDKLQEDGSYKMEILSNNKNLFDGKFEHGYISGKTGLLVKAGDSYSSVNFINVKNINKITISYTSEDIRPTIGVARYDENYNFIDFFQSNVLYQYKQTIDVSNCHYIKFRLYQQVTDISKIISCQVEKGSNETNYIPHKSNKIQFSSIEPLRGVGNVKDRFVFKDGKLMIERNCGTGILNGSENWDKHSLTDDDLRKNVFVGAYWSKAPVHDAGIGSLIANNVIIRHDTLNPRSFYIISKTFILVIDNKELSTRSVEGLKEWLRNNPITYVYKRDEPIYEEIPHELQKLILEGYENGTLFFDTNIPPTVTTTYSGEAPIVKATKLNKTEVLKNTDDINDNIVPYLMDMDYRVVCLQLEGGIENISMARLFGGTYEMLQRDILSNRYSKEEYKYRLDAYLSANKITESEYNKLGDMLNE